MFQLRILGEPRLLEVGSGAVLRLRPAQLALLAVLALAPSGGVLRATLAGMLWPESTDAAARRALRQVLFRLRRDIGHVVHGSGETLCLDESRVWVDVGAFERCLQEQEYSGALESYGGRLLAGFVLEGSVAFGHWVDREAERLENRAADACAALVEFASARGDHARALAAAERWIELCPLSEAAAKQLVVLRARTGDRSGALRAFEAFGSRVQRALGIEPGDELRAVVERIRTLASKAPHPHVVAAGSVLPGDQEPPLLGREEEYACLARHWSTAQHGSAQCVVVTGEPGIGKTRLTSEFAAAAEVEGATVLQTRAYEVERGIPYAALTGLLRSALDAPGLAAADAGTLSEISRIVPEIATRFRSGVAPPAEDLEAGRLRLLEAFRSVLDCLAFEAPLLLVVDDLPWADEASLSALHYVWRRLPEHPLLLLATARTEDLAEGPVKRMMSAAGAAGPTRIAQLSLGSLSRVHIEHLLSVMGQPHHSSGAFCELLEEQSGGNPLFLVEALRSQGDRTAADGGDTIRILVADRLTRLSPEAQELLRGAAVLGKRFPLPLAAAIADLSLPRALQALEELIGRCLVRQVEYGYDFLHDVVRQTVYEELVPERRALMHRRAYARLVPGPEEEVAHERANSLALHAVRGGLSGAAFGWLLDAAAHAHRLFAGAEAEAYLQQAVDAAASDEQRLRVWLRLGELYRARSLFVPAARAYLTARQWTRPRSRERLEVRIRILEVASRCGVLDAGNVQETVETILADARQMGCHLRDALVVGARVCLAYRLHAAASQYVEAAVHLARLEGEPTCLVRALLLRAQIGGLGGTADRVLPSLTEAVGAATEHGLMIERCDAENDLGIELCRLGRWDEAIRLFQRVIELGTEVGAVGAVAVGCLNLADVLLRRGRWSEAEQHLDRAAELSVNFDFPHVRVSVALNRTLLAWHRRDAPATIRLALAAVDEARRNNLAASEQAALALVTLGRLDLDDAEPNSAGVALEPDRPGSHPSWADDHELVTLARARVLHGRGDADGAVALLRASLRSPKDPYAAALLMLELAQMLRPRQRAEANHLVRQAVEVLGQLGAVPLLNQARALRDRLAAASAT